MPITAGYDVGGAHLKVALAENGRTLAVRQIACPLWQGLGHLDAALAEAAGLIARADTHAVTMTGELCELFPDRQTGVRQILAHLSTELDFDLRVYMGRRGFADTATAMADPGNVGSMNFLASADLVARNLPDALLVDMGSTTTDIIPIVAGKPVPRGLHDGERLRTCELVYTGLTRTDVTSAARMGVFRGRAQRLASGGFANMADVRRILGELPDDVDQHPTADGRGKSIEESIARFARCFGWDGADASLDEWREAAESIAVQQRRDLGSAVAEVIIESELPPAAPIIAAGIGAGLIQALAQGVDRECKQYGSLANATDDCRDWATRCAPAVAVAQLVEAP